jgi:hypothetical protein
MWHDGEGKPACGGDGRLFGHAEARPRDCPRNGHPGEPAKETEAAEPNPEGQECGTIDARANGDTISSDDGDGPSPLR